MTHRERARELRLWLGEDERRRVEHSIYEEGVGIPNEAWMIDESGQVVKTPSGKRRSVVVAVEALEEDGLVRHEGGGLYVISQRGRDANHVLKCWSARHAGLLSGSMCSNAGVAR